jgi:Predicted heme/steroid binding protein
MEKQSFGTYLGNIVADIKNDVDVLYHNTSKHKWDTLNHLKDRVATLENCIDLINGSYTLSVQAIPLQGVEAAAILPQAPEALNMPDHPNSTDIPNTPNPPNVQIQPQIIVPTEPGTQNSEQKTFTVEELAQYNGRDGNPAYVAVDGIVYDVTNTAVWAASTHFGLTAGNDWTNEFRSCHAGENILDNLPKVGILIESSTPS